jgi:hypothetical protein
VSFANPLMLMGLLAAAVPILIHLIHQRKPRRQPFAAIELLLRSIERVERRWRIRRFLLLAMRVLVLAALALAASKPFWGGVDATPLAASGPKRVAIVVDASLSMRARFGGGATGLERAKSLARDRIDRLGPEDQATIVVAEAKPRVLVGKPTASRSELARALDALEPTYGYADLAEAVSRGAETLRREEAADAPAGEAAPTTLGFTGEVVLFSDLAGHGLRAAADLALDARGSTAELTVVDVFQGTRPEQRENHAVTAVELAPAPGGGARAIEARARVRAFAAAPAKSPEPKPVAITLRSPEAELYRGSVDVVAGTVAEKRLPHTFASAGFAPVAVELEADALAEDDLRYAIADVRRALRVLIVDGAPSGLRKEAETFYLEAALAAGGGDQAPARVITADELGGEDLAAYDVLVLAGVSALAPADAPRVVRFVEGGGGLWITAAEGLDVDFYDAELGAVLPRPFRGTKLYGVAGSSDLPTLTFADRDHPILQVFTGDAEASLTSARSRGVMLMERDGRRALRTILAFDGGQPAMVEAEVGRGKVIVLATSIDRDLTDLPIRPGFLPLVQRTVLYLGNALARPPEEETLAHAPRSIAVPAGALRVEVRAPDGKTRTYPVRTPDADGKSVGAPPRAIADDTALPGHYRVEVDLPSGREPLPAADFAVNVDPRESDVRPLDADEARAVLLGEARPDEVAAAGAPAPRGPSLSSPEALSGALLALMLVAFVVESLLTTRRPWGAGTSA